MATITRLPASIRFNNPGAMWPGSFSRKFGSSRQSVLNDGEGNLIAYFPTAVQGAAAQFALLSWPKYYFGHTISEAIATWSGANNPKRKNGKVRLNAYLDAIERDTDWDRHDYIDDSILGQPETAIPFAKAMAKHEAGTGKSYPMTDTQWREAYGLYRAKANGEKVKIAKAGNPEDLKPLLDISASELGEREWPGKATNPVIAQHFRDAEYPPGITNDETAGCAAAVSSWLKRSGFAYLRTVSARRYHDKNYGIEIKDPEVGCIGVMWRESPNSWKGHIGVVVGWTATHIKLRGANQWSKELRKSCEINESWYPRKRFLSFRRPVLPVKPLTDPTVVGHPSVQEKSVGIVGVLGAFLVTVYNSGAAMWDHATTFFGLFASDLPQTAAHINTTVGASRSIAESSGLIWLSAIGLVIAGVYLSRSILRTIKRARSQTEGVPA